MELKDFDKLLAKYQQQSLSKKEQELVDQWLEEVGSQDQDQVWTEKEMQGIYQRILGQAARKKQPIALWKWLTAAAAVILLAVGSWLFLQKPTPIVLHEIAATSILPANEGVVLSVDNGEEIAMSDEKSGIILSEDGVQYLDGTRVLADADAVSSPKMLKLSTARGKIFQVTLSDGTKVWLNASSTISYPMAFSANERRVEITGEAYFEVAKQYHVDAHGKQVRTPFIVGSKQQEVEVLGTHFNIKAYENEDATATTLLEGSVAVADKHGRRALLKPGQQARVDQQGQFLKVGPADVYAILDWKNNLFSFHDCGLKEIMKEVERWYDIDVEIQQWPSDRFYGEIKRDVPLSELLKLIQMSSNLKFKVVSEGSERRLLMQ